MRFTGPSPKVDSRWFVGAADIPTYKLDELLGTKLRALYQRKKGRDLFDLGLALRSGSVAPERIVEVFNRYMQEEGAHVTRALFEQNLVAKWRACDRLQLADPESVSIDKFWEALKRRSRR